MRWRLPREGLSGTNLAPRMKAALVCALLGCSACGILRGPEADFEVYLRAESERVTALERDVARLQADLREAEEALVATESGLRGHRIRADAVSALAQARIEVDRARTRAPWRSHEAGEAQAKLEEAERQLADGHVGSAIFFASRASRIASTLLAEADRVARMSGTRFAAGRVNLRSQPSGNAEVKAVIPQGLPMFPEREEEGWLLVRTVSGHVGWVDVSLVKHQQ